MNIPNFNFVAQFEEKKSREQTQSQLPQKHIYELYQVYIPNFNFLDQFRKKIEEKQLLFRVEKGKTLHIFPPNRPKEIDFLIFYTTLGCKQNGLKRNHFCDFNPSVAPPSNWAQLNFDSRSSPF